MTETIIRERHSSREQAPAGAVPARALADDKAMLRAAANLTRDLNVPSARIYWADLIASAVLGYGGLAGAILAPSPGLAAAAAIIAILALYRAGSFIHELTLMR